MKKIALVLAYLTFIIGCAIRPIENKVEQILALENDSLFVQQALPIFNDVESENLKHLLNERLFPLVVDKEEEVYQSVLMAVKESHNAMQYAMLANSVAWKNRDNKVLENRLFLLIEDAVKQCQTDEFIDALSIYLEERDYTPLEKIEAEPQYRAMVLDTYAYYLMKMNRQEEALSIYQEILEEYEDPEILINASKAQASLNRYQQAMESILKALRQAPAHPEALRLIYEYGESLSYPPSAIDSMVEKAVQEAREETERQLETIRIERPMPAFTLENIDGTILRSEDLKGKILVIDFFATWCGPCRRELPKLHQLYKTYREDDTVHFIVISTDEDRSKVKPFLKENNYTFPVYYGNGLSDKLGVKGVPTIYIVDGDGTIRYEKRGYAEGEDLEYALMMYINSLR
ncbi:MAG: redoxin domain-containing protein [Candidatus Marinimicrobia bacterium]|nr:redoxin domain-containing protein [Candidatus Neomarinimicrobiota bacterium]